jgi:uncharacterized protein (DUF486 family)
MNPISFAPIVQNPVLACAVLLTLSNIFMTFAWYGHLKHKDSPLWIAILVSWGLAFFEYCLQVPANRWGHATFSAAQLKIMQEVITLSSSTTCGPPVPYGRRLLHLPRLISR